MSEALERVIAEQQKTIDHLNERIDSALKTLSTMWTRHNELFESFARLTDAEIPKCSPDPNADTTKEYRRLRHSCRLMMLEAGYCMTCYNFICECDGQYD